MDLEGEITVITILDYYSSVGNDDIGYCILKSKLPLNNVIQQCNIDCMMSLRFPLTDNVILHYDHNHV